jgi:preprotein translocase subunit YajC
VDPLSLLMIVAAGAAFYFLIIRPGRQRQRQQQELIAALAPGAEIMTTAGIFGTVAVVTDQEISVEVSPGVHLRLLPAAVARVVEPAPSAADEGADGAAADVRDRTDPESPVD